MTFSSLLSTIFFCPHTGFLTWDLTFRHTIHTSLTMSLVDGGGGGGGEHAVFDDELFDDAWSMLATQSDRPTMQRRLLL